MNSNRSRYITGGLLAVGLGIGAALATPGLASADPSTDPYLWIDQLLGGLSVPAQTTPSDIQISISGINLFPITADSPIADSEFGDIAIAIGNGPGGAIAMATGGIFDVAFADGANSSADSGNGGSFDTAIADGANSESNAEAGNLDVAFADGTNSVADAGGMPGGCVFTFVIECTPETPGSFDLAAVFGDMLHATATGGNFLTDILPAL
jgi:hypothetical protein